VLRSDDLKRGLLQLDSYEICKLVNIALSLSTDACSKIIIVGFLNVYVLPLAIDFGAALVSSTFDITHSSNFESRCGVFAVQIRH